MRKQVQKTMVKKINVEFFWNQSTMKLYQKRLEKRAED